MSSESETVKSMRLRYKHLHACEEACKMQYKELNKELFSFKIGLIEYFRREQKLWRLSHEISEELDKHSDRVISFFEERKKRLTVSKPH